MTPEAVRDLVLAHERLRRLTLDLTDFFATNLTHLLVCPFCNSLVATVELVSAGNAVSVHTIGLLLPVVVIFLQLSYFSQELSDASLALQWSAFRLATGGGVALAEVRALRLVMLAAGRQPALSCKGLGRLSLEAARLAFRQFYSTVNVLRSRD
ncbi:uncharacterized protein LOC127749864 [Frankliniella occidentalis]|uniref:Uncharacterized protein LOC127749864 n=1 Tax=Frankliniella occidentalis TaxID=133901 RepID=A0A9C6UDN2_FRAOC|nr:uncharacterized protein LOC127749864 [Frankliniella occidentalis]